MDGGVNLTSRTTLPASDSLHLDMEYLATENQAIQDSLYIESEYDENGILLYPDGQPRFRLIYTNGGSATNHGNSMGEDGRERIRQFFHNGGSYTGSCAGAFISSISYLSSGIWNPYYHIWPGRTASTGVSGVYTGHFIESGCALLDYFDFGGDMYIDNIIHMGGCYARETIDYPPETEVLLRYDYSSATMHMKPSCWAYKSVDTTGRIVVIGSHPEGIESGERLNLMQAILLYALDGVGTPGIKAILSNGETVYMDRFTSHDDPLHTRIGDKQYHHFRINLPDTVYHLRVNMDGEDGYPFNLYLNHGDFAYQYSSDYYDTSSSSDKILDLPIAIAGDWFIGIECDTTVDIVPTSWGFRYNGALEVLDGLPYNLTVYWDSTLNIEENLALLPNVDLRGVYPNPFNIETAIEIEITRDSEIELMIYNVQGQLVRIIFDDYLIAGNHRFVWDGTDNMGNRVQSGMYLIRLKNGKRRITKRIMLVK